LFRSKDGSICHRINGREIREHRLVYEQHYNCCLLPKTEVRHKNGIKTDNRIDNLEVLGVGGCSSKTKEVPSDRQCIRCDSYKTKTDKDGHSHWFKRPGGYIYHRCHDSEQRKIPEINEKFKAWGRKYRWKPEVKERRRIRKCERSLDRQKVSVLEQENDIGDFENRLLDPNLLKMVKPRQCEECGSITTGKDKRGEPNWYKPDGRYQCNKCYLRKYNRTYLK
jgi:hypothetical protein